MTVTDSCEFSKIGHKLDSFRSILFLYSHVFNSMRPCYCIEVRRFRCGVSADLFWIRQRDLIRYWSDTNNTPWLLIGQLLSRSSLAWRKKKSPQRRRKQGVPLLGARGSTGEPSPMLLYWVSLVLAARYLRRRQRALSLPQAAPFVIEFRSVDGAHVTHNVSRPRRRRRRSANKLIYAERTRRRCRTGTEGRVSDWTPDQPPAAAPVLSRTRTAISRLRQHQFQHSANIHIHSTFYTQMFKLKTTGIFVSWLSL